LVVLSGRLFRLLDERGLLTAHQREALYRLAQLVVVGSALAAIVLGVWNVSPRNVILGAGVTSVVVALAARQTLSSIIAGVIIIKDFDDSQVTLAVKMWVDEPR
jgi:small-conductance mechanosensitive channel